MKPIIGLALAALAITGAAAWGESQGTQGQGQGQGQAQGQAQGQGAAQAPPAGQRQGRGGGFRQPDPYNFDEHEGWTPLFDGKTLNGWSGDSNWKVEDGAIVVEPSCEHPTGTIYLVWQGGETSDFELKLRMKGTGNINGGVQYRSWIAPDPPRQGGPGGQGAPGAASQPCPSGQPRGTPPDRASEAQWNMWGAQYDFDAGNRYTGQFYEQGLAMGRRGIVAWKGQIVRTETGKNPRLLATIGDQAIVDSIYRPNDWNELHIIAIGNTMTHLLNGRVISALVDEDATMFRKSGKIGIEVESTGKLFTKDIWLKKLP